VKLVAFRSIASATRVCVTKHVLPSRDRSVKLLQQPPTECLLWKQTKAKKLVMLITSVCLNAD
jgi:hypothetical protein